MSGTIWLFRSTEILSEPLILLGCPARRSGANFCRKNCISARRDKRILDLGGAMRRLTDLISEGFIWGVGITRPKPGQARVAALYITVTLIASILAAFAMFVFLLHRFHLG
jgi:hypothetical protein